MKYWVAFILSVVICAFALNPQVSFAEETNTSVAIEQVQEHHLSDAAYEHIWNLLICLTIASMICAIVAAIYSDK